MNKANTSGFFWGAIALLLLCHEAYAVPSFSRQTGQPCAVCHLNHGELTPDGKQFKLLGYSTGNAVLPLSVMGVASVTRIQDTSSSFNPDMTMPRNGALIPESGSLLVAGKFLDHFGGYIKWSLNGANTKPIYGSQGLQVGTKIGRDFFLDASEIRYARETTIGKHAVIVGATANNAPTVQDLWVTTPVSGYPYRMSGLLNAWGLGQFGPATMIDGGLTSQIGGYSIYAMVDDTFYAELGNYQNMKLGSSLLTIDQPRNLFSNDLNPYWRLAYNHRNASDTFMLGTFGMISSLTNDKTVPGSASGKYVDIGLDGEYQHITDKHSWTGQFTLINERVNWNALDVGVNHDAPTSNLETFKAKVTYDYARKYGASAFGFYSTGSTDTLIRTNAPLKIQRHGKLIRNGVVSPPRAKDNLQLACFGSFFSH